MSKGNKPYEERDEEDIGQFEDELEEDGVLEEYENELDEEFDPELDEQQQMQKLDAIGMQLAKCRSRAMEGRANSGIEEVWTEDEEHYEGIDDCNRGEYGGGTWGSKPVGQADITDTGSDGEGSTIFINITAPYCDAAAARVGDMLLPTDEFGFSIDSTPIPSAIPIAKGELPPELLAQVDQSFPNAEADEEVAAQKQKTIDDFIESTKADLDRASQAAKKAETRIQDWLTECQYQAHARKQIDDCAKIGTGILKGPIPDLSSSFAMVDGEFILKEDIKPVSRHVSYRNCYPDPNCGNDIHNGSYHWERDTITKRQVHALLRNETYIQSQVELVIEEGPTQAVVEFSHESGTPGIKSAVDGEQYEIWYYFGSIDKEDLEAAGCECEDDQKIVDVSLEIINNHVVRAQVNMNPRGSFPYDYMVWKRLKDTPFGMGVARQVRAPQEVINGAVRNMMDNAGLAGGPMSIYLDGLVEPENGIMEIKPRKMWVAAEDAEIDDVRKAFSYITMPMMTVELQSIINQAMKWAEDTTGLPMIMQGQQGKAPDTVGGMQILNNNASTVLRRIARQFDDLVTEPHIRRYYDYLLEYGEDDEEKGDFIIDAKGSSALVERDIQNQNILNMGGLVTNPIFGWDPKRWGEQYLRSQHLSPSNFEYDDEEWRKVVEQMSQPPQQTDSRLEEAKMRMEFEAQTKQAEMEDKQRDRDFQAAQKDAQRRAEMAEQDRKHALQVEELKAKAKQHADKMEKESERIKADLVKEVNRLKTQVALSRESGSKGAMQVAEPMVEPPGRAEDGKAFED